MTTTKQIIIRNIATICRSCLRECPNMLNLYQEIIYKMYTFCTTIECEVNDGLPKMICKPCLMQIQHFYNFKKGCQKADAALKEHVKKIQLNEIKQEIIENLQLSQELSIIESVEDDPLSIQPQEMEVDIENVDPLAEAEPNEQTLNPNEMKIIGIEEVLKNPNEQLQIHPKEQGTSTADTTIEKGEQGEQFPCTLCNKTFDRRSYLLKHMRRHPDYTKERFKCIKCKTEYTNVRDLNEHFKTHGGRTARNAIKCPGCIKNFFNYKRIQVHFNTEHITDGDVTCIFCHTTFTSTSQLREHVKMHLTATPLKCNICGQTFKSDANLKVHMKKHNEAMDHVCEVCDKHFMKKRFLQRHMKTHARGQTFFCDTCDEVFSEKSKLIDHFRLHGRENPFKCPTCDVPCFSNKRLQEHLQTHAEDRPYICKVCSKSFKLANTLIRHILTHPGQEPFKCNECGMRFLKKMHLKTHKMKHY